MLYPDKFPYVSEPPEGWLRAIGKALKHDCPVPRFSMQLLRQAIWKCTWWLIGSVALFALGLLALLLAAFGVRILESGPACLWPAYGVFPFFVIAAGLAARAGLISGKVSASHGAPNAHDAHEAERELTMRRYDRRQGD